MNFVAVVEMPSGWSLMRYLQQHLPDYDGRFRSVSEAQGILGFRIAHGLREQDMTFYERALAAAWLDPEINYVAESLRY